MTKKSYEDAKEDFIDEGYVELPFCVQPFGFIGHLLKLEDEENKVVKYKVFPFVAGEYVGIRLDWEVSYESVNSALYQEQQLLERIAHQLIFDVFDIVKNVSENMTNGDIFHPIIPTEAYDE